ncbi:MAG: hypothetical protein ACKON7_06500, partial [Planctomycetaceae bacterium]
MNDASKEAATRAERPWLRGRRQAAVIAAVLFMAALSAPAGQAGDPYLEARQAMVAEHGEGEGGADARGLVALRAVRRHLFVSA